MKASVTPTDTRRVLAAIRDAVQPVEHARTAAAVDRVLETASLGMGHPTIDGSCLSWDLRDELGMEHPDSGACVAERCGCDEIPRDDATPGMTVPYGAGCPHPRVSVQRVRYAPWVVSPHLFSEGQS